MERVTTRNENYFGRYLAQFLASVAGFSGEGKTDFEAIVRALVRAQEEGHSCLLLTAEQQEKLQGLSIEKICSAGERETPLVLVENRLYLQRYHAYEKRLAVQLKQLAARPCEQGCDTADFLDQLFREAGKGDLQRRAAELAQKSHLTIISGGPGTGKTTTVVKVLAALLHKYGATLQIALAAPTGKAAMRLSESVEKSIARFESQSRGGELLETIPKSASTLHRLLGVQQNSPQFVHNRENPLPYDVVVVDEASMVDLALMSKLVDAVKPGVHLILLGDKDQLASVESGSVLVDVVAALPGNAIELKKSYRFDSNIKKLAAAVNGGEYKKAWDVLTDSEHSNINLLPEGVDYIVERYSVYMERVRQFEQAGVYDDENIRELFNQFHSFQVLCVTNYGRNGIYNVNSIIERRLKNCGFPDCRTGQWYSGRPVMITSNEYNLGLYNGDVGICLLAGNTGGTKELKVWFERGDSFVALSPGRLPARQTVFAMTIHKSQGSEFADVLVMLPEDENQILCRELLYTGITRAKENVVITGSRDIWYHAVQQKVSRNSGLKAFLLQPLS